MKTAFCLLGVCMGLSSLSAEVAHEEFPAYLTEDPRLGESLNVTLVGGLQVEDPWDPDEGGFFSTADIFVAGNYAYMGSNAGVLHVVDISDPAAMRLVAQVDMPGPAIDVKVHNDLAVVAVQNGPVNEIGMVVVDVSDPPEARIVSILQNEFWSGVHNLYLDGSRAYLAHSASRGLTVVDLSDPARPAITGTWRNEDPAAASIIHDVFVAGGLAFLSDLPRGAGGLVILDLSHPDQPTTLARVPIEEGLHNCFAVDGLAYCNQELGGWRQLMHIIDIADPAKPQVVNTFQMKRSAAGGSIGPHNTWVRDGFLYWAYYDAGVHILDLREPTRPVEVAYYRTPYAWSAQPHDDGLFYVADARLSSVRAMRFDVPDVRVIEASLSGDEQRAAGVAHQVVVEAIVESSTGEAPQQVTARLLPEVGVEWVLRDDGSGAYHGIGQLPADLLSGQYYIEVRALDETGGVYPYTGLSLQLVPNRDQLVIDDELPVGTTLHAEGGAIQPVFTADGPVFAGDRAIAFEVQPNTGAGWSADFHFEQRLDFLGYSSLRFALHPGDTRGTRLNVHVDEFTMTLVGRRSRRRVDLSLDEWQIVDVPVELLQRERSTAEISFDGDLRGTFYVDDVRLIPSNPAPTAADTPQQLPVETQLKPNYPNPFNASTTIPFGLQGSGHVSLEIFNLAGQKVAVLLDESLPAGAHSATWDAVGSDGRPQATGVYVYRLRTNRTESAGKLLLLR